MRMACIREAFTSFPLVSFLLTETVSACLKALKKKKGRGHTNAMLTAPGGSPQVNSLATTGYSGSTHSLQSY